MNKTPPNVFELMRRGFHILKLKTSVNEIKTVNFDPLHMLSRRVSLITMSAHAQYRGILLLDNFRPINDGFMLCLHCMLMRESPVYTLC